LDLLRGSEDFEVGVHESSGGRGGPGTDRSIPLRISKEVKIREKSELHHLFPLQGAARRIQRGSSGIVSTQGSPDGLGPGLQSFCNVLPKFIPLETY
jgi:hypothetical protein